jgi:hypothetical protein
MVRVVRCSNRAVAYLALSRCHYGCLSLFFLAQRALRALDGLREAVIWM